MTSPLQRLAQWYQASCDGDWEHASGIAIQTLDNPGWSVNIDLGGTALAQRPFDAFEERYDHASEWMRCWREGSKFQIACGPARLEDALIVFLDWAEGAG